MRLRHSSIELLEPRIAPARLLASAAHANSFQTLDDLIVGTGSVVALGGTALPLFQISADGKIASYTEFDGDLVSLTVSKGRLTAANFTLSTDANNHVHVDLLDISFAKSGKRFQGANLTVNVTQAGGDGFGDFAAINAKGIDLGRVVVTTGDLGQIDVGDADLSTPALRVLQSSEMGFAGPGGQIAGQDTASKIRGSVGSIKVDELLSAFIDVRGSIGRVSLGDVDATRDNTDFNGSIRATGPIGTVNLGAPTPQGLLGGAGSFSGVIWSRTRIGSITVSGDVKGGGGFDSGAIFAGSPDIPGAKLAGAIGPVLIYGSLIGGVGKNSGTLYADSGIRNVTIGGNVTGGDGESSGSLVSGLGFANISIRGDLASGAGAKSGSIIAFGGNAPNIVIGGKITSGNFAGSGIFINGAIGTLSFQSAPEAGANATEIRALRGIGTVNVFGDMNDVFIRAGANIDGFDRNANASIGTVIINGNFDGGGLLAGGTAGQDGLLFSSDDVLFKPDHFPAILSRISTVIVGGTLNAFAIEAEQLSLILVGNTPIDLDAGPHNDNFMEGATVIKEIS